MNKEKFAVLDNPRAFPHPKRADDWSSTSDGMMLLDYFAGQALAGICASEATARVDPTFDDVATKEYAQAFDDIATKAYAQAVAMLNERQGRLNK